MRVALLAPLISPIREPQIGGVATFVTDLAAGLQQAGHEIDLFTASGSSVPGISIVDTGVDPGDLASTLWRPFGDGSSTVEARRRSAAAYAAFESAYRVISSGRYDLVHNHAFDAAAIELAAGLDCPVIHTLHLPPDPLVSEAIGSVRRHKHPPLIAAVSETQRRGWERHNAIDVLLRAGVPTARIPWSGEPGSTLVFAGRLSPEKGVLEAIEIARNSGRHLVVAGTRYDEAYADRVEHVADTVAGVRLAGALPRTELWRLMTRSAALLFPILWDEPFGLVTAEAQAAGCPVIGFRGGALCDVVQDGVTGAVVEPGDVDGACAAVSVVDGYDRAACRRHAERSLDIEPTIRAHLALYDAAVATRRSGLPHPSRDPEQPRHEPHNRR